MSVVETRDLSLDEFGILRRGSHWIALTPTEQTVMSLLLNGFGGVIAGTTLARAVWPEDEPDPTRRGVHVIVFRLRKRIGSLGLAISTIRGQGFLLDWKENVA